MHLLQSLITNLPQIIVALLVFSVLIFVHEMGHFIAAKRSGIKVNEFAMGMGPVLFQRQKGETMYSVRWFPIGGYCAMEGDDEDSEDAHAFGRAPLWKRMTVILAGSAMNLLLGLIILGMLSAGLFSDRETLIGTTQIYGFHEKAVTNQWLQQGDTVKKINNHSVRTSNDMMYELSRDRDGIMDIVVERQLADGTTESVLLPSVTFLMREVEGVSVLTIDFTLLGVEPTFGRVFGNMFNWTGSIIKQVWGSFADLLTGRYSVNQVSGFVGVTGAITEAVKSGFDDLLMLTAFITINLGVFNLLPLPALDGGRFIFLLIEAVRRKPIQPRYEGLVHGIGFALLIALMIFVTFNDVAKIVKEEQNEPTQGQHQEV